MLNFKWNVLLTGYKSPSFESFANTYMFMNITKIFTYLNAPWH